MIETIDYAVEDAEGYIAEIWEEDAYEKRANELIGRRVKVYNYGQPTHVYFDSKAPIRFHVMTVKWENPDPEGEDEYYYFVGVVLAKDPPKPKSTKNQYEW